MGLERGMWKEDENDSLFALPVVVVVTVTSNLLFQDCKGIQRFGASGQQASFVHWQRLFCRSVKEVVFSIGSVVCRTVLPLPKMSAKIAY